MRIFPVALTILAALSAPMTDAVAQTAAPHAAGARRMVSPAPAGRLADALLRIGSEAGVNIVFDATLVGDRRTLGFARPVPLRQALDQILSGSGLAYRLSPTGDVSISAARPVRALRAPPLREMAPDEVEPVIVLGYRDTLNRAEARARRYDSLVEIISADAIGKLPDGNIADALDRLPSVYRVSDQGEGRYLALRGLSQELNAVTLNGVTIATSDTDGRSGRAAPLDVLSASAIADVEIHSVVTPDRDAGAIGGLINVRTPSAFDFDRRLANLTTEVGVLDADHGGDIHAVRAAYADVLGPNGEFGIYVGGERWVREYLSPFYDVGEIVADPSGTGDVYPDRILLGTSVGRRERTSLTAALEWRNGRGDGAWLRLFATDYDDEEFRPEFLLYRRGALSTSGTEAFSWRGVRVRTETRDERQERPVRQYVLGGRWALNDDWTLEASVNRTGAKERNPYLNYYETGGDIDPVGAGAPDIARFLLRDGIAVPDGPLVAPNGTSIFDGGFQSLFRIRRITSEVAEDIDTQQVDLTRRGFIGERPFSIQVGAKRLARLKSVDDADHRYNFIGAATLADPALTGRLDRYGWGGPNAIASGLNMPFADPGGLEALFSARPDLFVYDAPTSRANSVEDDYRIRETLWSAYAMTTVAPTPDLRLTLGVRVEHTRLRASANAFVSQLSATGFPPGVDPLADIPWSVNDILTTSGSRDYTNVLPAILVKWDDGGGWILRASLTHAFARPDYVSLAPISNLSAAVVPDPSTGAPLLTAVNEIGNPDLEPIESRNWDASAQYRFRDGSGWIQLAAFHKSLDGVLFGVTDERHDVSFAGVRFDRYTAETVGNVGSGRVSGLEVSGRYDFLNARGPLSDFGILVNAAFLNSRISAPNRAARPLKNQADFLYNAQLYYEREAFQVRLAYGYQGRAPRSDQWSTILGANTRAPLSRLDLKVIADLTPNWRAAFSGTNLTNEAYRSDRSSAPYLAASGPGYAIYGREYRLSLTRRW